MTIADKESEHGLERRVTDLRARLRLRDSGDLAQNTGTAYADGRFSFDVWNRPVIINGDDFIAVNAQGGQACDPLTQAMLAYYFYTSDGAPVLDDWISFSELADGQFYTSAFQGYTGNKLAKQFGNDIEVFKSAASELNGRALSIGDAGYRFQMLPRVPVVLVCWMGDDDFPPSYRVLFDRSVNHHLPTDACAILGSMLTTGLIKAAGR